MGGAERSGRKRFRGKSERLRGQRFGFDAFRRRHRFRGAETEKKEPLVTNTILASEVFKQAEEEYYVYFYDYNEEDSKISSSVNNKLSSSKVYKVDTSSALNNKYVSEESNKSAKKLNELKVKAPTIVKITGEEITAYYEGDEILNNLK